MIGAFHIHSVSSLTFSFSQPLTFFPFRPSHVLTFFFSDLVSPEPVESRIPISHFQIPSSASKRPTAQTNNQ